MIPFPSINYILGFPVCLLLPCTEDGEDDYQLYWVKHTKLKIKGQMQPGHFLKHLGEFKLKDSATLLRWLLSSSSINKQGLPTQSFVLGEHYACPHKPLHLLYFGENGMFLRPLLWLGRGRMPGYPSEVPEWQLVWAVTAHQDSPSTAGMPSPIPNKKKKAKYINFGLKQIWEQHSPFTGIQSRSCAC